MKLSKMSLLFVLIIIPILLVFSKFVNNQIKTVEMKTKYDTKIMSATQDAIKSLEMNTFGVITKSNTASMRRNIQASVNSFVNSYAANFGVTGYDKSDVLSYVPALLFTMYDGIYIYGPTTDQQDIANAPKGNHANYVLKPYIYYSARYKNDTAGNEYDVVINYSLDNYINITGTINGDYISRSGYLIDTSENALDVEDDKVIAVYENGKRVKLENELLYENITFFEEDYNLDGSINQSDIDESPTATMDSKIQKVINGEEQPTPRTMNLKYKYGEKDKQKYYYFIDEDKNIFRIFKYNALGKIVEEKNKAVVLEMYTDIVVAHNKNDSSAKRFYQEAYEFSKFIEGLGVEIKARTIVKPDGGSVQELEDPNDPYFIFKDDKTNILNANIDKDYFKQHKLNIMKTIITDNLNVAISSYSNGAVSDFYMPEISETEWEKILTNISMVSFVQGMPMGLKTYNNYVIVTSTNNELYVGEDSIYYVEDADNEYNIDESGNIVHKDHHTAICKILNASTSTDIRGYASTEFDKHTVNYMTEYSLEKGEIRKTDHYLYYYKHHSLDCYNCIVSKIGENSSELDPKIISAKIHAIARIKHNQIKTTEIINNR